MRLFRLFMLIFFFAALSVAALVHWKFEVRWVLAWLLGSNLAAFLIWAYDKRQARREKTRVPEIALHAMALVGATPASFLAMSLLRHKNLKMHFNLIYAVFLVLQIVAAAMFWTVA